MRRTILYIIYTLLLVSIVSSTKGVIYAKLELNQETRPFMILPNVINKINVLDKDWTLKITQVEEDHIVIDFEHKEYRLNLSKPEVIDLNKDGYYDVVVTLDEIRGRMSFIKFKHIQVPYRKGEVVEGNSNKSFEINETWEFNESLNETPMSELARIEEDFNPIQGIAIVIFIVALGLGVYYMIWLIGTKWLSK